MYLSDESYFPFRILCYLNICIGHLSVYIKHL